MPDPIRVASASPGVRAPDLVEPSGTRLRLVPPQAGDCRPGARAPQAKPTDVGARRLRDRRRSQPCGKPLPAHALRTLLRLDSHLPLPILRASDPDPKGLDARDHARPSAWNGWGRIMSCVCIWRPWHAPGFIRMRCPEADRTPRHGYRSRQAGCGRRSSGHRGRT